MYATRHGIQRRLIDESPVRDKSSGLCKPFVRGESLKANRAVIAEHSTAIRSGFYVKYVLQDNYFAQLEIKSVLCDLLDIL